MSGFKSWEELKAMPPQEWLIQGHIPTAAQALLYGPSGQGKSFVAMDWALSVATGQPWLGKFRVKRGAVIYIACEGAAGLPKRVAAWLETHNVTDADLHNILFRLYSLNLYDDYEVAQFFLDFEARFPTELTHDSDTGAVVETVAESQELRLVVVDTLARVFRGDNENDNRQMGEFLEKLKDVVEKHKATLLYVHHAGKAGEVERGATALRAAMESVHKCKGTKTKTQQPDGTFADILTDVVIANDKQKDDIEGSLHLRVHRVELESLPPQEDGRPETSLVLELADPKELKKEAEEAKPKVSRGMRAEDMVRLLAGHDKGLTYREWMLASGLTKTQFNNRLKALKDKGLVTKDDTNRWSPADPDEEE